MKIPTDCNKEDQKFPGQFNRMTQIYARRIWTGHCVKVLGGKNKDKPCFQKINCV